MLKIIYRISDKSYEKEKIPGATKESCFKNCWTSFNSREIFVIADNCSDETIQMMFKYIPEENITRTSLGNAGSFRFALDMISRFDDEEIVYVVEDDYIHNGDCTGYIEEGLNYGHYVTLFDYIDKYRPPYNCEVSPVFRGELSHWRWSISTTMTVAAKAKTFKEDNEIWQKHILGPHPNDHFAFVDLGKKGRRLCVAIPGRATHADLTYYKQSHTEFPDIWAIHNLRDNR